DRPAASKRAMDRQIRAEKIGREGVSGLKSRRHIPFVLLVLLLCGCEADKAHREARRAVEDYREGDFREAIRRLQPLSEKTNEDFVLNNCRLGSADLVE